MRPLRHVGINAVFLESGHGGLETYVRELVPELRRAAPGLRLSIFANESGAAMLRAEPWAGEVEMVTHPLIGRRPARALSEALVLSPVARRRGVDLMHSVGGTGPLSRRPRSVVQVSDVIWLTHSDPADRITAGVWRVVVPLVARRAERVITLSQASRRELVTRLGLPPERIDVVPLGPGVDPVQDATPEVELRERLGLGHGPIVLALAAKRRHKNLAVLVEALPRVLDAVGAARLVLPGRPTPYEDELRALADGLGVSGAVAFPPYLAEADVEGLYACAACLVFPSYVEGFGLPILEAMRRRVPVACAAASAPSEVAGDAALFFDPDDPTEVADATITLLTDPRRAEDLTERGHRRAAEFSWRATAERTLESWERAWTSRR